jgi:Skp family chaperone for outer membrane proteins
MKFMTKSVMPALFVAALAFARPSFAQDAATRIATANPGKILQQMQERQDKQNALKNDEVALNAEGKKKLDEIKELGEQREKFSKKGTPEYTAKSNDILEKQIQLQVWDEVKKQELLRRHNEEFKALFAKIQQMIATVAQEKKIDLVITDFGADFPDDLTGLSADQMRQIIGQKNILYTNKGVDISAEVTARLDAAYKK